MNQVLAHIGSHFQLEQCDPLISRHALHWVLSAEVYNTTRRLQIEAWKLVAQYSTYDQVFYTNEDFGIMAYRGSADAYDIYNDVYVARPGSKSFPKVAPAIAQMKQILSSGEYKIQVTGHSLGGALARHVGQACGLGVVTFNAASPPSNPATSGPNEVDYHIVFDVISAWQHPNTIRIDKGYRPVVPCLLHKLPIVVRRTLERVDQLVMSTARRIVRFIFHRSTKQMIMAHKLENFSNAKSGTRISNENESALWMEWWDQLPKGDQQVFRRFVGIGQSLPPVS